MACLFFIWCRTSGAQGEPYDGYDNSDDVQLNRRFTTAFDNSYVINREYSISLGKCLELCDEKPNCEGVFF